MSQETCLNVCSASPAFYGGGGVVLFAGISAAAIPFGVAAAFLFVFLLDVVLTLQLLAIKRQIAHRPLLK